MGVNFCKTCELSMCDQCSLAHRFMTCFKSHEIENLVDRVPNQNQGLKPNQTRQGDTVMEETIPSDMVGHIIGRKGWIRELEGAAFKITGSYHGVQSARTQIQSVVNDLQRGRQSKPEGNNQNQGRPENQPQG